MIKALKALNLIMFILCAIVCAVNIKAGHIGSGAFVGSCGIVNLLFAVRGATT